MGGVGPRSTTGRRWRSRSPGSTNLADGVEGAEPCCWRGTPPSTACEWAREAGVHADGRRKPPGRRRARVPRELRRLPAHHAPCAVLLVPSGGDLTLLEARGGGGRGREGPGARREPWGGLRRQDASSRSRGLRERGGHACSRGPGSAPPLGIEEREKSLDASGLDERERASMSSPDGAGGVMGAIQPRVGVARVARTLGVGYAGVVHQRSEVGHRGHEGDAGHRRRRRRQRQHLPDRAAQVVPGPARGSARRCASRAPGCCGGCPPGPRASGSATRWGALLSSRS